MLYLLVFDMSKWIQKAVKRKGIVHKILKIPKTKKIPMSLLNKRINRLKRKKNKTRSELKNLRRLVLARTLKRLARKR